MYNISERQKIVGLLSGFGMFVIFLTNILSFLLTNSYESVCKSSLLFGAFFSLSVSIIYFLTIIKSTNFSRLVQIATFLIVSVYSSIANDQSNVTYLVFAVYSIILFWVYYKEKFQILYVSIISALFIVFTSIFKQLTHSFFSQFISDGNCTLIWGDERVHILIAIVSLICFISILIGLIYVTVIDEIRTYFEKSNKLQIALYKSESDAWYGRNVIGVVHNIKNKLTPVYLLLEEFSRDERIDKEMRDFCRTQIKSVDGLSGLLDKLMYSTKIKNKEDLETININKTVKSVVEFFKSNLEFKKNINLTVKQVGADVYFKGNPMNFCFVIENIIKNSYDSLKSLSKIKKIDIEIINKDDIKYISIKDNGTGIKIMKEDEFSGSLLDCHFFKIGNTTKKNGLGYGMEFIKSFIVENKLEADIYSKKGFGTEIKIIFK